MKRKWLAIGIILLFIGTNIISSTIVTRNDHLNQREESACKSNDVASQIGEQDQVRLDHKSVRKESSTPSDAPSTGIEWITYGGENYLSIGVVGGYDPWEGAIRLTPVELAPYDGWRICSVKYFHGYQSNPSPEPPSHGNIKIYGAGSPTHPGIVLDSEPFWTPAGNAWFQFNLSNLVIINASQDYWFSVEILDQNPGEYPLGIDAGPAVYGKGDFCELGEGNWAELYQYGWNNNWNHMVGIAPVNTLPPPIIYGPTDGWTHIEYLFWTDPVMIPNSDSFYCKWNWDDGTMTEWLGPYASGSAIFASHTWIHQGVYEIRAKIASNGGESNWSEPHTITIIKSGPPPEKPIIDGPSWGIKNINYSFCMTWTDPESKFFYFMWNWGDGNISEWLGPYSAGQTICSNHSWSQKGTYAIQVKLKDEHGVEIYSDFHIFNVYELKKAFIFGRYTNLIEEGGYSTIEAVKLQVLLFKPFQFLHYIDGETITFSENESKYISILFFRFQFIIGMISIIT
jgi:hypothetical protein